MKKIVLFVLPAVALLMMVSCQKELTDPSLDGTYNGGSGSGTGTGAGSTDITGNWTFVSSSGITQSTVQLSQAGVNYKTITNSSYNSTNPTGTVTITSNTMSTANVSYTANYATIAYTYVDNVLLDSLSQPLSYSVPSTSATSNYNRINQDSIYFPAQGTGASATVASGARIALSGNILSMTTSVVLDSTINVGGSIATQHSTGTVTTTLRKQ
ncbi:MAG TPA: hypothetical protein VGM41_05375 [Chitinophagaceae bacterium]|jgi:hypothetical protein